MPVNIQKNKKGGYKVSTPGGTKAKSTSKEKAMAQRNLLNAVEHGWKPSGKPSKKSKQELAMAARATGV